MNSNTTLPDAMAENRTIQFGIRDIKELEFFVDEEKEVDGPFDFSYNVDIFPNLNAETMAVVITASYLTTSSKELFLKGKYPQRSPLKI